MRVVVSALRSGWADIENPVGPANSNFRDRLAAIRAPVAFAMSAGAHAGGVRLLLGFPRFPGFISVPGVTLPGAQRQVFRGGSGFNGGSGALGCTGSTAEPGSTAVTGGTPWFLPLMSMYGGQMVERADR